jgi:hypothetical protein
MRRSVVSALAALLLMAAAAATPASAERIVLGHGDDSFLAPFAGPALAGESVVMGDLASPQRVLLETPGQAPRTLATLPAPPFPVVFAAVSASSTRWAAVFVAEESRSHGPETSIEIVDGAIAGGPTRTACVADQLAFWLSVSGDVAAEAACPDFAGHHFGGFSLTDLSSPGAGSQRIDGRSPSLAGRYVAYAVPRGPAPDSVDVVVYDRVAGQELYRVAKAAGRDLGSGDPFAVQDDGTLVVVATDDSCRAAGGAARTFVFSADQPSGRALPFCSSMFTPLRIAAGRVLFNNVPLAGSPLPAGLALTDLAGNARLVATRAAGWDLSTDRVAWLEHDCDGYAVFTDDPARQGPELGDRKGRCTVSLVGRGHLHGRSLRFRVRCPKGCDGALGVGGGNPLRFGKNAAPLTNAPGVVQVLVHLSRNKARLALRRRRLSVDFRIFGGPATGASTTATLHIARG